MKALLRIDRPALRAGFLLTALLLGACAGPTPAPAAPLPTAVIYTQAAPTADATAPAAPTETPTPAQPTATTAPANTAAPARRLIEVRGQGALALAKTLAAAAQAQGWQYTADAVTPAGGDLVILNGAPAAGDACQTAAQLPGTPVITLAAPACDKPPANLLVFGGPDARQDQAGFLAGAVAALATTTERVAVFADTTTPEGLKYRNGFLSGVRYLCAKCRLDTIDWTGAETVDFASDEGVKYAALGADVIFAAAGSAGDAALQGAARTGAHVIGAGRDVYLDLFQNGQAAGADRVLTSVYLDPTAALSTTLASLAAGQPLPAGVQALALANGGVILAPLRDPAGALSPLDRRDLEAARAKLTDRALETGVDPVTGAER